MLYTRTHCSVLSFFTCWYNDVISHTVKISVDSSSMVPGVKRVVVLSTAICYVIALLVLSTYVLSYRAGVYHTENEYMVDKVRLEQKQYTNGTGSRMSNMKENSSKQEQITLSRIDNKGNSTLTLRNRSRVETDGTLAAVQSTVYSTHSVAELFHHLVSLTATSNNHFHEIQGMLATTNRCLPHNKIIVYDLGLNDSQRKHISSFANVELRRFPYDDYSHLPHVKKLHTYAWKPIIIKLVSQEYDVIMYGDASLRFRANRNCVENMKTALAHLFKFPLLNVQAQFHRAIEFTHDGMIQYLHYPKSRKDIADVGTLEASGWLMWTTDLLKDKVLEPWLDCALHQECIAPEGHKIWPCDFTSRHDGHYVGCHRYDQSAINLILLREFGRDIVGKVKVPRISGPLWDIMKEN